MQSFYSEVRASNDHCWSLHCYHLSIVSGENSTSAGNGTELIVDDVVCHIIGSVLIIP